MQAITYEKYGPPEVLRLTEIPKPTPKRNEVLIKIHASTVTSGDYRARSLAMPRGFGPIGRLVFGILRPRKPILGTELAGVIVSVGQDVRQFSVGDQVFAYPGADFGGYSEYASLAEDKAIAIKPANLTYGQAAALSFGGATALDFLRGKGNIQSGEKVLVSGASGAVGSAAVQLARYFGADVTGICSTANLDLVKSIGAGRVIDYTKEDFTRNGETYDIILDTTGTISWAQARKSLKENGRLLLVAGDLYQFLAMAFAPKRNGKKGIFGYSPERAEDLQFLATLAEAGKFKPHIDRTYRFEQVVEAHAYADTGRKKGNVVLTICQAQP